MKIASTYNKFIVSVLLSAATVVQQYPNIHWQQIGLSAIGSILVWLVPNSQPAKKTVPVVKGTP